LRKVGAGQLSFAFADSPQGGDDEAGSDVSKAQTWLLLRADDKEAQTPTAQTGEGPHLLEQVARPSNLAKALRHVARNKGAAGVDGRSVAEVVEASRQLLPELRRQLLSGHYQPGDIRRVWIPKPGGGDRGLGIPNVVDRWVQQALRQVVEPMYEPSFHDSNHGFRPRRGAHTALAQAKGYVEAGYEWVVDIDLSQFFDRVNHQRLLNRLAYQVKDDRLLHLVHQMLKANVVLPDGMRVSTDEGTPQGGPLSPLLSNVVLDELDWELERRGLRFVRYADDFQIFVRSERSGQRVLKATRRFLEDRLRLQVNEAKSSVDRPGHLNFLGFCLKQNSEGGVEIHLSARTEQRLTQRIRGLTPRNWGASLRGCMVAVNRYLRGWYGYYRLCTEPGARRLSRIDAHVRRRLRAIIIRQKGRCPRYLLRHLLQRGVSVKSATKTAYSRRGAWFKSSTYGMHQAYGNQWFYDRVTTLMRLWERENHQPKWVLPQQLTLFGA
jgi:RNA-directed DNA polymerase